MKLYVAGEFTDEYELYSNLTELHLNYSRVTEIVGSAFDRCMNIVTHWAEVYRVPLTLYFQNSDSEKDRVLTSYEIIKSEEPQVVIVVNDNRESSDKLIELANQSSSVLTIMVKSV